MKYNKDFTGEKYRDIAKALGVSDADTLSIEAVRDAACQAIEKLSTDVGIPTTISELGVKAEDIPQIAKDALKDVYTPGNPRQATLEEVINLYQSMM